MARNFGGRRQGYAALRMPAIRADGPQIVDEAPVFGGLRRPVGQPQQKRRMHGDEPVRPSPNGIRRPRSREMVTVRPVSERAAVAPSATVSCGLIRFKFAVDPPAAMVDLGVVRRLVDAPLAARLVFEMLHRVGDVDARAVDAGFGERAVEHLPGRSDEGLAGQIFLIARLLADEHHRRVAPALRRTRSASRACRAGSAGNAAARPSSAVERAGSSASASAPACRARRGARRERLALRSCARVRSPRIGEQSGNERRLRQIAPVFLRHLGALHRIGLARAGLKVER